MEINPVKGTHDIIGDEAELYREIEQRCVYIADLFAYKEIRTPIIEHTPLFLRSVGESSDIVTKEMYTFMDKGDRSITLRPEMTAGVMRSIVSNKLYANPDLPLKYFYLGPCFRYERPQAGRYRQFNQFGIEAVGNPSFYQDAEVISIGHRILLTLGLKNVKVLINSLGDEESRANYKVALKEYFAKHIDKMCPDCKRRLEINPLRILDCKVPEDIEIVKGAPRMTDYLSDASKVYLNNVISALQSVGIEVEIDTNLVRGLDYYTGVVFEYHAVLKEGEQDVGALGGGGHYANLLAEVGGPQMEGIGLAMGIERLAYVVSQTLKENPLNGPDFYIMGMTDDIIAKNFALAELLRSTGLVIDSNYQVKSISSLIKTALRKKAKFAIIIGEDEMEKKEVTVKNLATQDQTLVKFDDLETVLHSLINEYISKIAKLDDEEE
ncbi:MAG: histidine--tRNA ligase [Firmicutes bacterium]|nr:histidine--tRNA ligase [Candidatus Fiminaster equi]